MAPRRFSFFVPLRPRTGGEWTFLNLKENFACSKTALTPSISVVYETCQLIFASPFYLLDLVTSLVRGVNPVLIQRRRKAFSLFSAFRNPSVPSEVSSVTCEGLHVFERLCCVPFTFLSNKYSEGTGFDTPFEQLQQSSYRFSTYLHRYRLGDGAINALPFWTGL